MKKIAIIITIAAMASCKDKATEIPKDKSPDAIVNEAAVPYIAKEIGVLDFEVTVARDTTRDAFYRGIAIDKIRHDEAEYLDSVTIENIFSQDFEECLENQKNLIAANWRQIERSKKLKQLVVEKFKK